MLNYLSVLSLLVCYFRNLFIFFCLEELWCTAQEVEIAAIRQGAGGWAVPVRPTGDRPAPPASLAIQTTQQCFGFRRVKGW